MLGLLCTKDPDPIGLLVTVNVGLPCLPLGAYQTVNAYQPRRLPVRNVYHGTVYALRFIV